MKSKVIIILCVIIVICCSIFSFRKQREVNDKSGNKFDMLYLVPIAQRIGDNISLGGISRLCFRSL